MKDLETEIKETAEKLKQALEAAERPLPTGLAAMSAMYSEDAKIRELEQKLKTLESLR